MKEFYHALLPIERIAIVGLIIATVVLAIVGFQVPRFGAAVFFMLGTLTVFWAMMTLIAALGRFFTAKRMQQSDKDSLDDLKNK